MVKFSEGVRGVEVPEEEFIIISTGGKLLIIHAPFESADLLLMSDEFSDIVAVSSEVSVENVLVSATGPEDHVTPGKTSNSSLMSTKSGDFFQFIGIIDLDISETCSNTEEVSSWVPGYGGGLVRESKITEFDDLICDCTPEVDTRSQSNSEHILRAPVNKVQVKVILQGWSIKYLEWDLRYFSACMLV